MVQRRSRSLTYEEDSDHPLCLCEYYNKNNQRVHLLMCCCNCEAVDSLCTSILCCSSRSDNQEETELKTTNKYLNCFRARRDLIYESLADIGDRLRYPMFGGAQKFDVDFIISIVSILIYLLFGTINFIFSLFSIVLLPTLIFIRFFITRLSSNRLEAVSSTTMLASRAKMNQENKPKIRIAYFMISNCLLISFLLFNLVLHDEFSPVMTDLEKITMNFFLISAIITHFCLKYSNPGYVETNQKLSEPDDSNNHCNKCNIKRDQTNWVGHCPVCKHCVLGRDHHCFYLDVCIGYLNHKLFLFYLFNLSFLFTYSFYSIYKLLSQLNCNLISNNSNLSSCLFDVYYSNFSRSFLTLLFLQLGPIIIFVNILLLQQFLFIGLGLTQHQLYKMSQKSVRFSLFVYITSSLSFDLVRRNYFSFCRLRFKSDLEKRSLSDVHDHFV